MDKDQRTRLSWGALYGCTALNGYGLIFIFSCNVFRLGCAALYLYVWGLFWVGIPLFLVTLLAAPAGVFRGPDQGESKRYRRLFLLNISVVALIFIPAIASLFR
jgi:hypothetical protein